VYPNIKVTSLHGENIVGRTISIQSSMEMGIPIECGQAFYSKDEDLIPVNIEKTMMELPLEQREEFAKKHGIDFWEWLNEQNA
jgi:argininosuccinate synthase